MTATLDASRASALAAFVRTNDYLYNGRFIHVGASTFVFLKDAILHADVPPARVVEDTRKGLRRNSRAGWKTRCLRIAGTLWWCAHEWNPSGDVVVVVTGDEIGEPHEDDGTGVDEHGSPRATSMSTAELRVHARCADMIDNQLDSWRAGDVLHADAEGKFTAR